MTGAKDFRVQGEGASEDEIAEAVGDPTEPDIVDLDEAVEITVYQTDLVTDSAFDFRPRDPDLYPVDVSEKIEEEDAPDPKDSSVLEHANTLLSVTLQENASVQIKEKAVSVVKASTPHKASRSGTPTSSK